MLEVYPDAEEEPHAIPTDTEPPPDPPDPNFQPAYQREAWIVATAYLHKDEENPENNRFVPDNTPVTFTIVPATGNSGQIPPAHFLSADTVITNGTAIAKFQGNTVAGDAYTVKVDIPAYDLHGESGELLITPGLTKDITLQFGVPILTPEEGKEFQVTATLRDAYGNYVADGTGVNWYDYGLTSLVEEEARIEKETVNGRVTAWMKMGPLAESDPPVITVEADGLLEPKDANPSPVDVSLVLEGPNPGVELDVFTGQTGLLRATFMRGGVPVDDGLPVFWNTTNGRIQNASTSTSAGQATATLSTFGGKRGYALVSVAVGTGSGPGATGSVHFKSSAPASIELDPGFLYADEASSTNLSILGPPNGRARITIADSTTLLASFPFDRILTTAEGPKVEDAAWQNHAFVNGISALDADSNRYRRLHFLVRLTEQQPFSPFRIMTVTGLRWA